MCALTNSATPAIGRTHGIHAEPITFGLKIANWFAENQRNIARFAPPPRRWLLEKFPVPLATPSHLGPEIEEHVCKRLGLSVARFASQVIQRDRHAQYLSALALIAATLEKIALEFAISSAPKSAKRKNRSAASSAAVPPCLTSAIPSL